MIFLILFMVLALCLCYFIFLLGRANEDAFSDWKIKFSKPKFIFGHSFKVMFRKQNFYQFVQGLYNEFPEEKANGLWDMRTPYVLIRDLALLKHLAVKEFDHFMDHRQVFDEEMDSLMGNVLVAMAGNKWRQMRVTLSPAFTGSKMRAMFQLVTEVTEQLTKHLKESASSSSSSSVTEYDMKDVCSKYTNDVIALCAFGIQVDTLKNPDNEFHRIAKSVMSPNLRMIAKFMLMRFWPQLLKALKVTVVSADTRSFFSGMVLDTMRHREKHSIKRPDMINLLMEAQKGTLRGDDDAEADTERVKPQWTDDEMVAQCLMFFLAGYETSATVMTVAAYELTANPEVQQKLFEEIKAMQDRLEAEGIPRISYESIRELKYLDMVVNETLRKWPPAAMTDRKCSKDFEYKDTATGLEMHFEKGANLWIPIYGLHRDAQYFPDPDRFFPERFSEEHRDMVNSDAFIPFGLGPRSCIANRFALMEVKALLYQLVLNFELLPTKRTKLPVKITNNFGAIARDIFVGLKEREGSTVTERDE